MDAVSIRLGERMIDELEKMMRKHHFATITEFIRAAIRDKMKELEQEEIQRKISQLVGSSKRKTTDEKLHKVREKLAYIYAKKHNIK